MRRLILSVILVALLAVGATVAALALGPTYYAVLTNDGVYVGSATLVDVTLEIQGNVSRIPEDLPAPEISIGAIPEAAEDALELADSCIPVGPGDGFRGMLPIPPDLVGEMEIIGTSPCDDAENGDSNGDPIPPFEVFRGNLTLATRAR